MVCCFMTGVQVSLEQAYVLNRREARDLLVVLKDRLAGLRRVIEQFSPLDDQDGYVDVPAAVRTGFAPKKHRLVCKAVAEALAPGFPEIKLFMEWPAYQLQARQTIGYYKRRNPPEQAAPSDPDYHENQKQS